MNMHLGLLRKYPFVINDKLTLFPLLGIDMQIALAAEFESGGTKVDVLNLYGGSTGDLSALWFKFGGGLDYGFTANIFLRFETLWGRRPEGIHFSRLLSEAGAYTIIYS
jgi:hypothetical protein